MKHTSETMAQSRAWAAGLCKALEQLASCFAYWDKAYVVTLKWPEWRIYGRYGCSRQGLVRRRDSAWRALMDADLEKFKE